jgi:glyoxylate/hydroxypyruvate reductase
VACVIAALQSRNRFASLLILGVAGNFFLYFAVNMAMVTGLIPVVGVPLPLVSFGGSAMLMILDWVRAGAKRLRPPPEDAGMRPLVLFAGGEARWPDWEGPLGEALARAGIEADITTEAPAAKVDFILYAPGDDTPDDFTRFSRCRAVFSLWAGVERIVTNRTLTQPLCRMVDPGLTRGMIEYVAGHVLRLHLGLDGVLAAQDGRWNPVAPPLASERPVAMLGLGALGEACARALAGLGFEVLGWSRRPKSLPGIACHYGRDGLRHALGRAQIAVTLLPATAGTENILDAETLAWLPRGACIINPGRGSLIDDAALLAALDSGQLGQATLDVFRTEPLPADHPYWRHPKVTVTPHIAAETRPSTAAHVIAENIRRSLAGEPLLHVVDRASGY